MISKKALIYIFLFLSTFQEIYSQEFQIADKTYTAIFEFENKSKAEIFASLNRWISINYGSAQDVIQMNDKESGIIIVKGKNIIKTINLFKSWFPNQKSWPANSLVTFSDIIEINAKENRARVIYTISGVESIDNLKYDSALFDSCIRFQGSKEEDLQNYDVWSEQYLKTIMTPKRKKELYQQDTRIMFNDLNNQLNVYAQTLMYSLQKSVLEGRNDDW